MVLGSLLAISRFPVGKSHYPVAQLRDLGLPGKKDLGPLLGFTAGFSFR